jgi:hypothetical protein
MHVEIGVVDKGGISRHIEYLRSLVAGGHRVNPLHDVGNLELISLSIGMNLEDDSNRRPIGENQGTHELPLLEYLLSERLHVAFCRWRTWENRTDD